MTTSKISMLAFGLLYGGCPYGRRDCKCESLRAELKRDPKKFLENFSEAKAAEVSMSHTLCPHNPGRHIFQEILCR